MTLQRSSDQNINRNTVSHASDTQKELMKARLFIEALEQEQVHLVQELQLMQEQNQRNLEISRNKDNADAQSEVQNKNHCLALGDMEKQDNALGKESPEGFDRMSLQVKLHKLTNEMEKVRLLNCQYQEDLASQESRQHQVDLIRDEVETETTRTILHLQEEVAALQLELHEKLSYLTEQNSTLRNSLECKEEEIKALSTGWEKAMFELTGFLLDGSRSLRAASSQIERISCSFPKASVHLSANIESAAKAYIEKEETIQLLQESLEDAQMMVSEMEEKLTMLKGATVALNEFQQPDTEKETKEHNHLKMELEEKISMVKVLETSLKIKEDQLTKATKRADAAFLVLKWLSDSGKAAVSELGRERGSNSISMNEAASTALMPEDIKVQVELARIGVIESNKAISTYCADAEVIIAALHDEIFEVSSACKQAVEGLMTDMHDMWNTLVTLKAHCENFKFRNIKVEPFTNEQSLIENQSQVLRQIKDELTSTNNRLDIIADYIKEISSEKTVEDEKLVDAEEWSVDCSISSSDSSSERCASEHNLERASCTYIENLDDGDDARKFSLRKEIETVFDAFNQLRARLNVLLDENDILDNPFSRGIFIFSAFIKKYGKHTFKNSY